jgi:hypothetical protein
MTREERLAANEARFREMNEGAQPRREATGEGRFICECADRGCTLWVEMTPAEYGAVRAHQRRFLVKPTHEIPDVETVIERHDRYFVIEKPEDVAHMLDPDAPPAG